MSIKWAETAWRGAIATTSPHEHPPFGVQSAHRNLFTPRTFAYCVSLAFEVPRIQLQGCNDVSCHIHEDLLQRSVRGRLRKYRADEHAGPRHRLENVGMRYCTDRLYAALNNFRVTKLPSYFRRQSNAPMPSWRV